ncbi:hypothetical protein DEO23_03415 [Brachybacterium endophyticum]|uniref:Uncharacterized protein n=1 Tax=Brachybacterium endophyticum TaxID=2182385 RepID=A0A2U2RP81_9MICO|nr:hypothetical protein [Brachybacterium endophyticum]PWH07683.1 hypothetical protein DEO23_03415 [Brachybacterium endophyticum]
MNLGLARTLASWDRRLRTLPSRLGAALLALLALTLGLRLLGIVLHPVLPLALLLVIALISWLVSSELETADALDPPYLDDDPEAASPHAGDVVVRRLEEMIHGAAPRRRMTSRTLGRALAEVATERSHRDDARALPQDLQDFLTEATRPLPADDARTAPPLAPVDRATLHRWLRALSDPHSQEDTR